MDMIIKEGKDHAEVLEQILDENNLKVEEVVYRTNTKKGGLFKGNIVEVCVYKKADIMAEVKEYLKELITGLGLEVSFELKNKDEHPIIKMYSNDNPILIGKNGQTLKALETLVKQMLQSKYGIFFKVNLDVENYKDKKEAVLVRLAKKTAKEVVNTNVEVHMDNMTSYERRIIHNALTNFKGIITESEGEEPHRHIVIKPKK